MPAAHHHQGGKMEVAKRNVVKGSQTCRSKQTIHALEPVLEHYEAPLEQAVSCFTVACGNNAPSVVKKGKSRRVLTKLRDGYVKLMNDMAAGADFSGVSLFYGCPGADYEVFNARVQMEEREKKAILQALELQLAHPRLIC